MASHHFTAILALLALGAFCDARVLIKNIPNGEDTGIPKVGDYWDITFKKNPTYMSSDSQGNFYNLDRAQAPNVDSMSTPVFDTAISGVNIVTDENGGRVVTTNNGAQIITTGNGGKIITGENGRHIIINGNGGKIVTDENGAQIITNGNGGKIVTDENGAQIITSENGDKIVIDEDGRQIITNKNGNRIVIDSNGNTWVLSAGQDIPKFDQDFQRRTQQILEEARQNLKNMFGQ